MTAPGTVATRAGVGLLLVLLVSTWWPTAFALSTVTPWTQAVALRAPVALGCALLAVICGLSWRRSPRVPTLALTVVLALTAAVHLGVLVARATGGTATTRVDLTVMTLNTQNGGAAPGTVARAVADAGADVVALPETTADQARQIATELLARDITMAYASAGTDAYGQQGIPTTTLMVRADQGYRIEPLRTDGFGALRATAEGYPSVAAVHPHPPAAFLVDGPGRWSTSLRQAVSLCGPVDVVAGDFNATADHAPMRLTPCDLATVSTGDAATGTWPAAVPRWLGTPIDNVLLDPTSVTAVDSEVVDVPGTDHRGVVVRISRAG